MSKLDRASEKSLSNPSQAIKSQLQLSMLTARSSVFISSFTLLNTSLASHLADQNGRFLLQSLNFSLKFPCNLAPSVRLAKSISLARPHNLQLQSLWYRVRALDVSSSKDLSALMAVAKGLSQLVMLSPTQLQKRV
jgi:hypothetical protein